MSENDRLY